MHAGARTCTILLVVCPDCSCQQYETKYIYNTKNKNKIAKAVKENEERKKNDFIHTLILIHKQSLLFWLKNIIEVRFIYTLMQLEITIFDFEVIV